MRLDYIVGNPPYQMDDGGYGASARPLYHLLSNASKSLATCHCLIQPARWMTGGKWLDGYRAEMIADTHIREIEDFDNSKDVFRNVDIKAGVMIYVYDNDYDGKCEYIRHSRWGTATSYRFLQESGCDIVIRDNELAKLYHSVWDTCTDGTLTDICSPQTPYGLCSDLFGHERKYNLPKLSDTAIPGGYSILGLDPITKRRAMKYAPRDYPIPRAGCLGKYKLFISKAYGNGTFGEVPAKPVIASPGMACTTTFLEIGPFDTEEEVRNLYAYLRTKFFRALVGIRKRSQNAARNVYSFIPIQDFTTSSDIDWSLPVPNIDKQLYTKYGLTDDEIDFIEEHVKPMS